MALWNLTLYHFHKIHLFSINPHIHYNDLIKMINTKCKLNFDNYILEIYDLRYRQYLILNEEYILDLQNRLPRTSITTLSGRLQIPQRLIRNPIFISRKRKRTLSFLPENEHIIIWLDSYIDYQFEHQFSITTMFNIARSMIDYEICIDNLIQIDKKSNQIHTFNNKIDCLNFLEQIQSKRTILFVISNFLSEEIVPLIVKQVYRIYILVVNDQSFSSEWAFDYLSNLLIFDNMKHLFVRIIRDLAQSFFNKAEEMISKTLMEEKILFLKYAKKLFNRANDIDDPSFLPTLNLINRQLDTLESNDEKDEKFALECDEG